MSTITKERMKEIRDFDTCVTLEESAELARIALASLTAEPAKCGHVNLDCDDGKAVCLSCGKVWEV